MPKWQRWKGIQKCYPFEEKRLAKWTPPYIVQPKYDGVRCRAVPIQDGYLLLSSEENVIYSVPHIDEELSKLKVGWELDGELYCHGMSFEEIVSITSRTVNIHSLHKSIKFHVFDIVDESQTQTDRLTSVFTLRSLHLKTIRTAPIHICESLEGVMRAYDTILKAGYEGIIVRHCAAPYVRKRSTWVMKFKPKKEDDYEITGFVEEVSINGVPKGVLGSLQCKSGDGNTFSVGTGFDEEQRSILWSCRESLIGKIAKVKYQHLTSGKKVPRFPVFVEVVEE